MVFTMYWGLVYPYLTVAPSILSYFVHGVNFLVMAVDMIVCRQVFRLAHGVYFFAYCLLYLLWSGIYEWLDLENPCNCPEGDDDDGTLSTPGCIERGDGNRVD